MKKSLCVLSLVLGLLLLTSCSKKKDAYSGLTITQDVLKIGMEIGYPPFEYFADDGKTPKGFDVELGKELARRLGLKKAEFIDTAWDGILAGLDTNKYDCIISAMTLTEDRQAHYDFSRPYIGNGQSIVLLKTSTLPIKSPQDLTGLQVGYQDETTSDIFMAKQAADIGLKFVPAEYDKVLNAFDDLRLGRIDAVCADALVSVDYINKPNSPFVMVWQGEAEEFFGVCFRKGNTELQTKCTKAITDMFEDGTLVEISKKIFGQDMVSVANH